MQKVQEYNPFTSNFVTQENLTDATTGSGAVLTTSDLSEVFLKSYTVASGVSSITISDALFKLSTYKTIHVRFNNLTTTGATSSTLYAMPYKNGSAVSGTYNVTSEGISSSTATGFSTASFTNPSSASISTGFSISFASGVPQVDVILSKNGLSSQFDNFSGGAYRRYRATVVFPSEVQTFTSSDYAGMILGLSTGTFTGGTVSVFGVQ